MNTTNELITEAFYKILVEEDLSANMDGIIKDLFLLADRAKEKIAEYLIRRETITGKEFMKIFRAVEKGWDIPDDLEIETFVHGAMCISYSGRCLLSNFLTGRDRVHEGVRNQDKGMGAAGQGFAGE